MIIKLFLSDSDKFELKFPELSQAKLKSYQAKLCQAEHFNFRAETELDFFFDTYIAFLASKISHFKKKQYYLQKRKPQNRVKM